MALPTPGTEPSVADLISPQVRAPPQEGLPGNLRGYAGPTYPRVRSPPTPIVTSVRPVCLHIELFLWLTYDAKIVRNLYRAAFKLYKRRCKATTPPPPPLQHAVDTSIINLALSK